LSVRGLRAAIGLASERFEEGYVFLGGHPALGLVVEGQGDAPRLVTAPDASAAVERHPTY
jgi:hypothetical protein